MKKTKGFSMSKVIVGIIFLYLCSGAFYYVAFFGKSAQEGEVFDVIIWIVMATLALATAGFLTYTNIKFHIIYKKLPPEDIPEGQAIRLKEDIMFEILRLENPGVDFSPQAINLMNLLDDYKVEERFGDKSVAEMRDIRDNLLK